MNQIVDNEFLSKENTIDTTYEIETLLFDRNIIQISKITPFFENLTKHQFIWLTENIFKRNDIETTQQFLYYLLLFRNMSHLQEYINSMVFTKDMLEQFFLFIYGYCTAHDHPTEKIMDEIISFLDNNRLQELVLHSPFISNDKLMLFFILSRFDTAQLNHYFLQIQDIDELIESFLRLPENVMRAIISRNYKLFQYIMLHMAEDDSAAKGTSAFYDKYRADIEFYSKLSEIVKKYHARVDHSSEAALPFHQRNLSRISYLVNLIRDLPDPEKAIEYFYGENIFADEMEKEIVYAIISNPILKHTFRYYNNLFDLD